MDMFGTATETAELEVLTEVAEENEAPKNYSTINSVPHTYHVIDTKEKRAKNVRTVSS